MQSQLHRHVTPAEVEKNPFLTEAPLKVLHKIYEMWNEVPYSLNTNPTPLELHPIWDFSGNYLQQGEGV
jgi:hypothetical protein